MDGVGLGRSDPSINPFAQARTPNIMDILGGKRLLRKTLEGRNQRFDTPLATLLELDAVLGIDGAPQSASGQAAILTGINIPEQLGYHYGPKPDPAIMAILKNNTLFHRLIQRGYRAALLNSFPQSYFDSIKCGRRLPGAVAMSVINAGIPLKTTNDLISGQAISADFTGQGWRERLNIKDVPLLSLNLAGKKLANIARDYDFSFFEYWLSDYAGHKSDMNQAVELIESFDQMLGGLLASWNIADDLILIISDHGNIEDLRTRKHTRNPVPGLVIGPKSLRHKFCQSLVDLTGITPAILQFFE